MIRQFITAKVTIFLDKKFGILYASLLRTSVGNSTLAIDFSTWSTEKIFNMIPPTFPNKWTRSCMAINSATGSIDWVVEGVLIMSKESKKVKDSLTLPKDLSGKLILGAVSWGDVKWKSVSNKVTHLNIFSSSLSVEEMKSMTNDENCVKDGDYLAWRDMEWVLHGKAMLEHVIINEPCEGAPLANLFHAPFSGWKSCMHLCENLDSRAPSVTTHEDWTILKTFLKKRIYDKGFNSVQIWLPISDEMKEGTWKDISNITLQSHTLPWIGGTPDGGEAQNCAYIADESNWSDRECDWPNYSCMCSYKPKFSLKLLGLCPSSKIDVFYKPMNDWTDFRQLKFQGVYGSSITYHAGDKKMWSLKVAQSNISVTSKAPHASFTLGKHNWTIRGNDGCNHADGVEYVTELKMSGCQDGEFTCNDGQCVNMTERCNQLPKCRDESDEKNCQILVLKDGYNKNVPPVNSDDPLVNVSISIDLLRLVDINEADYSIEIQFEIMLKWKENRATYNNLKKTNALNALTQADIEKIWLPEVIYENTDQKESTRLGEFGAGEWKTNVVISREEDNGTMRGLHFVDETEFFHGSQNSLVMNQSYTHIFQCNFELAHYPFDNQVNLPLS